MGERGSTRPLARVRMLGGFQLLASDDAPIRLTSRRARSLLAVVCLEGPSGVPRDRLCGLLWSDRAEEQARASLRQCLFELKAGLGDLTDQILDITRDRVSVRPGALDTDVAQVRQALTGAAPERLAAIPQYLAGGGLLEGMDRPGLFQDWLEQSRGAFEASLAADLLACLDQLAAEGRWDEVRRLADAGLRRDPLQEALAAAAIRADRATGQEASAQRRFQATKAALAEELGVAPGPVLIQALSDEAMIRPPAAVPAAPAPPPEIDEPVLAVLAFDNLSGDPALDHFSQGVSDEIQHTVAQAADLKVIARSSSFQFRGGEKAVRKVAEALRATHVLDGSVRHSGDRVRISAQLVQCAGETTLWANRFDGEMNDMFALQERIAIAVAQALKVTFAMPASVSALEPATYQVFLRAREILGDGGHIYDETGAAALPLLEQVTSTAPNYAPGWELLAKARALVLRSPSWKSGYAEGRAGAIAAAETALRLDPKRGRAHEALARLEPWGAYSAREALLEKALAVTPNDPGALTEMSNLCWGVGRFRDALAFSERACELNPLMPAARLRVAEMLTYVGDYEASIQMMQDLFRRWPEEYAILLSLLNYSSALGFHEVYRSYCGEVDRFAGWQGGALRKAVQWCDAIRSNDPDLRQAVVQGLTDTITTTGVMPLNFIEGISALGFTEEAFDLAEQVSYQHLFEPDGPNPGPFPGTLLGRWSALNKTRRFIPLCDRLGLCAYWAHTRRWPDCVDWAPFDFKAEVRRQVQADGVYAAVP